MNVLFMYEHFVKYQWDLEWNAKDQEYLSTRSNIVEALEHRYCRAAKEVEISLANIYKLIDKGGRVVQGKTSISHVESR